MFPYPLLPCLGPNRGPTVWLRNTFQILVRRYGFHDLDLLCLVSSFCFCFPLKSSVNVTWWLLPEL